MSGCGARRLALRTTSSRQEGALFSFGEGDSGKLGHGSDEWWCLSEMVDALRYVRITAAAAGGDHSLALPEDGTVFSWGCNRFGKLGIGHTGYDVESSPEDRRFEWAPGLRRGCWEGMQLRNDIRRRALHVGLRRRWEAR